MKQNKNQKNTAVNQITEGVIWKQLLIFFFPILFGTLFQQIYNTADTVVVGRFVGKEALAAVAEAFVTQDPDGNGEDDTIGILGPGNSNHINDIGDNQFGLDPLFCSFQSYPQYWLQDEDGTVKYGSIQPETRVALEKIQKLYTDKLIDPEDAGNWRW